MRSILEKAIVHLLNEEQDKAEALFHQFMVEKARRIHESLRSGEVTLSEGWDDEITSEEYMSEDDLESIEDHGDEAEMGDDEATDTLSDDMGVDGEAEGDDEAAEGDDAAAEGDDAEAEHDDMDAEEGEGNTDDRLADLEDQIEKLTAEFDEMMSSIDGDEGEDGMDDGETSDEDGMDSMGDEGEDGMEDDSMTDGDEMGDVSDDHLDGMADQMEDDVTDGEHDAHDEMAEGEFDNMDDMHEGKMPPWLKNSKKGKKPAAKKVKESDKKSKTEKKDEMCEDDSDEDLNDITESVMAELEKISVSMSDGQEVGTGKKITTNDKSPLIQASVDKRGGAKPVTIKGPNHQGFERETAPTNKTMTKAKNTVSGKADSVLSKVADKGDKSALLNKDFAGDRGNSNKSTID